MIKKITFLIVFTLFFVKVNAQQPKDKKLLVFDELSTHKLIDAEQLIKEKLKLSPKEDLIKVKIEKDNLGFTHEKYQQYFKGVKVEFGTYIAHAKNGKIKTMNGELFSVGKVSINPVLSNSLAFEKAIASIEAKKYLWDVPEEAKLIDDYKKPTGELLILPAEIFKGEKARLVYKFDIYSIKPLGRVDVYVDAHTGEVVFENNKIHHADTPATGTSLYNGTVSFTADLSGGTYSLEASNIETYDMNERTNYSNATSVTSSSSNFSGSETAVQAHWGAEQTNDYFFNNHGRDSYDNNGAVINRM